MSRYRLQEAFKPLGPDSTSKLAKSHVVVIGCGAIGSHVVDTLARMGVGYLTLVDDDVVTKENLHRQLYCAIDCSLPKAKVLVNNVSRINSDVYAVPIVDRVTADNINSIVGDWPNPNRCLPNLILDCTDNMETRWLINEYSVKHGIPWIYCGVGRSKGMVMPIIPGKTACLRCTGWAPKEEVDKPRGGIFPPAVAIMANIQATIAVKILTDNVDDYALHQFDVWSMESMSFNVQRNKNCPVCGNE